MAIVRSGVSQNTSSSGSGGGGVTSNANGTTYAEPVYFENGQPGAPAIGGSNFPTTGLYWTSSGLGVTVGATARAFFGNDGSFNAYGGVNILGTLALSGKLALVNGATIINTSAANPNGVEIAAPGSLALSSSGGVGASAWVKETGLGNTGWQALGKNVIQATGPASLTPGACVSLTPPSTAGHPYTASLVSSATLGSVVAMGVVVSSDGQGNLVVLAPGGMAAGVGSGLTPQQPVYVGQSPDGYLSSTPPSTAPYYIQVMGVAISGTDVLLNVELPSVYRAQ